MFEIERDIKPKFNHRTNEKLALLIDVILSMDCGESVKVAFHDVSKQYFMKKIRPLAQQYDFKITVEDIDDVYYRAFKLPGNDVQKPPKQLTDGQLARQAERLERIQARQKREARLEAERQEKQQDRIERRARQAIIAAEKQEKLEERQVRKAALQAEQKEQQERLNQAAQNYIKMKFSNSEILSHARKDWKGCVMTEDQLNRYRLFSG